MTESSGLEKDEENEETVAAAGLLHVHTSSLRQAEIDMRQTKLNEERSRYQSLAGPGIKTEDMHPPTNYIMTAPPGYHMYHGQQVMLSPVVQQRPFDDFGCDQQRVGQWTREEEAYTSKIATLFKSGKIPNCPEGITMRSLLSNLLNCAPMRVSKKFSGEKAIGKRSYRQAASIDLIEKEQIFKELVQLEQEFHNSVRGIGKLRMSLLETSNYPTPLAVFNMDKSVSSTNKSPKHENQQLQPQQEQQLHLNPLKRQRTNSAEPDEKTHFSTSPQRIDMQPPPQAQNNNVPPYFSAVPPQEYGYYPPHHHPQQQQQQPWLLSSYPPPSHQYHHPHHPPPTNHHHYYPSPHPPHHYYYPGTRPPEFYYDPSQQQQQQPGHPHPQQSRHLGQPQFLPPHYQNGFTPMMHPPPQRNYHPEQHPMRSQVRPPAPVNTNSAPLTHRNQHLPRQPEEESNGVSAALLTAVGSASQTTSHSVSISKNSEPQLDNDKLSSSRTTTTIMKDTVDCTAASSTQVNDAPPQREDS